MTRTGSVAGVCLFALASAQAIAAPGDDAAAVFGARPAVLDVSLSPSGNRLAYVAPSGGSNEAVVVVDLAGSMRAKPVLQVDQENAELTGCDWATDVRIICRVYYINDEGSLLVGYSRIFSIDADTGETRMLSQSSNIDTIGILQFGGNVVSLDVKGEENSILMTRQWVEERTTGTRMNNTQNGLGVDIVDVVSGRKNPLESPDLEASSYVADENGELRMKTRHLRDPNGRLTGTRDHYFRTPGSHRWIKFARSGLDEGMNTGFHPIGVSSAENRAYGFAMYGDYQAVYTIALEEDAKPQLLLRHESADVDYLIRLGRDQRIVGASYATDKRAVSYFDPELDKLASDLHLALPQQPIIEFVGASENDRKLVLIAASDTDPGMVYLYDKDTRQLAELLPVRDGMQGRNLAEMRPVSIPARDGVPIPAYLTLPPGMTSARGIPAVVMPHGGPSSRDEWGFDWLVQFFAAKGYAVLQPNYRGSSGFGAAWFGKNGFQDWRTAIGDVNDAGRWLVSQGIADPEKLAIAGWSYGGYAALQSQVLDADLYKAVVAIAPVTDLGLLKSSSTPFTNSRLVREFLGDGPHIAEGSPARHIDAFKAPVLMFHGDWDQNVDVSQSRIMARRLAEGGKSVEFQEFDRLDHSLESSAARIEMLRKIGDFLDARLGE